MQTTTAPSEILLRLPESVRVALGAYMAQQQEPLETIIEQAIVNFLDEQTQPSPAQEEDPAVLAFLKFLEKDITEHPERLQSFSPEWVKSAFELLNSPPV
jgi:prlF antitoxin for toxin YhaV_toxin